VQDTFLRVARRPGGLPTTEIGEEAWLVRILVNLCRDRYRRAAVRQRGQPLLEANQADAADPESTLVARATVWTALARLSPRRRAVVVLHELEGRPVAQVAAQLGISRITVRWHLLQARRDLTAFLASRPSGPRRGLQSGFMRTRRNRRRGEYG
jgi:RNA polymerase sigma-70 factor, ECF subfamily